MGSQLITPDPGTVIWTVITFLCLAALLAKFAWKPLLTTLEEREAEETLRKNQEILAQARRETALIIEQGKREAESMRGEILAQARKEAQDLVEQGKRQVQYEQKQAIEQLRRQVADLAIQAAERLISRSLDDTKQRELLDDYVRGLTALEPRETHR